MTGSVPGDPRPRGAWRRRLLASALLFWPPEYRRRFGDDLTDSALRGVDEGASLVGEVLSISREGVRLRLRSMRHEVAALLSLGRSELRLALRSLLKSPGFTAIATTTLTIAIGATTAVFAVVDSVLLKPLPYDDPDGLAFVWAVGSDGSGRAMLSGPDAAVVREGLAQSEGVAFVGRPVEGAIELSGRGEHVRIAAVTPNLFQLLGVAPTIGGGFGDDGWSRRRSWRTPRGSVAPGGVVSASTHVISLVEPRGRSP